MDKTEIPVDTWMPISGRWTFTAASARCDEPSEGHPVGLALAAQRFRGGKVSFTVRFEGEAPVKSCGGIAIGYSSQDAAYSQVMLGGFDRAYAIQEFQPGVGWHLVAGAGTIANLEPKRDYHCVVSQMGQRLTFEVERVRVLEKLLTSPLNGDQLGLCTYGDRPVKFQDVRIVRQRPRVFVAMQLSEPFETFYKHVIRPVAEDREFDFDVVRIDEKSGPGIIIQDIRNGIEDALIVVAEITAPNENVFYELGYAHALNKPTILLAQRGKRLPFDVHSYRVIFYDDTIGGKNAVEDQLRLHFRAISRDSQA